MQVNPNVWAIWEGFLGVLSTGDRFLGRQAIRMGLAGEMAVLRKIGFICTAHDR